MTSVLVDLRDLERLVRELETFAHKALPFAARESLNTQAALGRTLWQGEMQRKFVIRNKFTQRSVRVAKVRGAGFNINAMESQVGSVAPYMRLQELGGTDRGKSGSKPIPTSSAAGQPMGARPRTRVVRRFMRQPNIRLDRRARGKSKKQRNAIAIKRAIRKASVSGRRSFTIIETRRGKAIARVTGRKKVTVRVIWDLSRTSVRVPSTPTLQNTLDKLEPLLPSIHKAALIRQLKRNHVLGF